MALVRTDVSEGSISSTISAARIGQLSETSVLTRATRRNIPDDGILRSQREEILRRRLQLLVIVNVDSNWPILVTVMMVAILPSETSVLIRATRRNIPKTELFIF
jgi:hypothetical protein